MLTQVTKLRCYFPIFWNNLIEIYLLIYLFICVYVYIIMYAYGSQRAILGIITQVPFTLSFEMMFLTGLNLPSWLAWLTSRNQANQGSACPDFSHTGTIRTHHHTQHFWHRIDGSNSYLCACKVNTWLSEPFPNYVCVCMHTYVRELTEILDASTQFKFNTTNLFHQYDNSL